MAAQIDQKTSTQLLLERIGGQAVIARECEVSDSAVSQWAAEDHLPRAREKYLRLAHPGRHWADYDQARAPSAADRASRGMHVAAAPQAGAHTERPIAHANETKGRG